jgi:[ribosomal protein S5]-alanine N-acetyltransferase
MQRPMDIQTERLILRVILPDEIESLSAGDVHRVELANGFRYPPDDPNRGLDLGWHLRALRADPKQLPWRIRLILERSSNTVIGSINLKGAPDAEGDVEIRWGLNEGSRGHGYATEAAAAVMQWAFQQPGVHSCKCDGS